jgi:peptide/nickel transport system ATP-binding protein
MYAGRIVEEGPSAEVLERARHPYTQALSAAFPTIGDQSARYAPHGLPGDPPWPGDLPSGCPFHPRCPFARAPICVTDRPPLMPSGPTLHACHGVALGWIPETPEVMPLSA